MDEAGGEQLIHAAHALFRELGSEGIATIAAVNGLAFGGGCELAMSCDVRIAARSALFGQPEIKLGIIPGFGGTQRLPRLVGSNKALEMNLVGDPILADEAFEMGLANRVVEDHELLDTALVLGAQARRSGAARAGADQARLRRRATSTRGSRPRSGPSPPCSPRRTPRRASPRSSANARRTSRGSRARSYAAGRSVARGGRRLRGRRLRQLGQVALRRDLPARGELSELVVHPPAVRLRRHPRGRGLRP